MKPRPASAAKSNRRRAPLVGLAPLLLLLLLWQVFGTDSSALFPRPSAWWGGFRDLQQTGDLPSSLVATIRAFVVALLISVILGSLLGALIGSARRVDRALSPSISFMMSIPPAAIVPVAMLIVGVGAATQIGTIVLAAVWPIVLNVASTARAVPAVRLESARMLGLPRRDRLRKVLLPSLLPGVLTGTVIAAPIAIVVTLLVEMLTSVPGLGAMLLSSQRSFSSPEVFALLVVVGILGYVLNAAVTRVESLLLRNWPSAR